MERERVKRGSSRTKDEDENEDLIPSSPALDHENYMCSISSSISSRVNCF
jgi:hypothetical protein